VAEVSGLSLSDGNSELLAWGVGDVDADCVSLGVADVDAKGLVLAVTEGETEAAGLAEGDEVAAGLSGADAVTGDRDLLGVALGLSVRLWVTDRLGEPVGDGVSEILIETEILTVGL